MFKRALGLAVAVVVGALLVSASGAATTKPQRVTTIDVSTKAAVVAYLESIHVNSKGAVIQRGRWNYAGARCPGKGWICASTKHTVVQIAKPGGRDRFACRSGKCVVVQLSGVSDGVYVAGRSRAATAAAPRNNTAACIETYGTLQACLIVQLNSSGNNTAGVYQYAGASGLTLTALSGASITQQAASGNNTACVDQTTAIAGNTVAKGAATVNVNIGGYQTVTINQDSSSGNNNASQSANLSGGCTGGSIVQSQSLSSVASGSASITQNEDAASGNGANVVLDIEQNQHTPNASGTNNANFTQTSNQSAVANTPKGPVSQTQSFPETPPKFSGIVGSLDQTSTGLSTATVTQNETQCEDAAVSGLTQCLTGQDTVPYSLTQTQYGPEGVFGTPTKQSGRARFVRKGAARVPFVHKGYGVSSQTSNPNDTFTLTQNSTQNTDKGSSQSNIVQGDCTSTGSCTASQTANVNNTQTQDGYTAPSIPTININCQPNQTCSATPPPTPTFVSGPSNPNPSSNAAFNFTDTATGGIHFLCKIDGTPQTCQSGVAFFQGYGPHTFQVAASDGHGNVSAYVPATAFSWTNVPPDPTITPSSEPSNPEPYGNTDTFVFTDAESPVHFQCTLDGNELPCNSGSISYTDLPSGEHTFSVRAFDTTDTYGSIHSATYTWWITPPDPTITSTSPPSPDFSGNSYTFTWTDQDSTVQYQCSIDGGTAASCSSGQTYSDLPAGPTTFTVTAYGSNDSGFSHPDTTPPTVTWTILPLSVSALGGDDGSSAGWACQPGGPIALTVGSTPYDPITNIGTFAQITLTGAGGTAIDGLPEPTFTTDNYNAGSPRFVIDLSNGESLWGYPPNANLNGADFAWAINNGNSYMPWNDVQSAEPSQTIVDAYVIADGDQSAGTTDNISDLTFNGTDFNPGTCPAPPPAP